MVAPRGKDSVDLPFPNSTTQTWLCVPYWSIPWAKRAGRWADSWIGGPGQSLSALWEEGWGQGPAESRRLTWER